jgi:hypothetical protein
MVVVPVGPFARSVISTAILVVVLPDAGGEGSGLRLAVCAIGRVVVVVTGNGDGGLRLVVVVVVVNRDGELGIASQGKVCHDSQLRSKAAGGFMNAVMLLLRCWGALVA